LKGKVRSLLEMKSGLMGITEGKVVDIKTLKKIKGTPQEKEARKILQLFGAGGDESEKEEAKDLGLTRVSFTDCYLSEKWKAAQDDNLSLVEVKAENSINRITGTAENPRFTERVPAGAVFNFIICLKELEGDQGLLECLLSGLQLLNMDALGGSGSRGYGRIALSFKEEGIQLLFDNTDPFSQCR
jgi:CRISPR-associated protein Csm3